MEIERRNFLTTALAGLALGACAGDAARQTPPPRAETGQQSLAARSGLTAGGCPMPPEEEDPGQDDDAGKLRVFFNADAEAVEAWTSENKKRRRTEPADGPEPKPDLLKNTLYIYQNFEGETPRVPTRLWIPMNGLSWAIDWPSGGQNRFARITLDDNGNVRKIKRPQGGNVNPNDPSDSLPKPGDLIGPEGSRLVTEYKVYHAPRPGIGPRTSCCWIIVGSRWMCCPC